MNESEREELELSLLLSAVEQSYGYDFHNYAKASLLRRVKKYISLHDREFISDLIPLFLHNDKAFARFVQQLSVPITEMFRDPDFFHTLRSEVMPLLKTYPFIKVWHAGCATGQEVYSMAIMLEEEGLLDRCRIYATDFNESALEIARNGIYPSRSLELYENNYEESGGRAKLSDYYHQMYDSIKLNERLLEKVTFANHNLVTDGVFGEMNLILCRNVLIYFNQTLQDRVLSILADSLCSLGFLCIGKRENLQFSPIAKHLDAIDRCQRVYRKKD